jgi:Flp pilus assembly protein TadD
MKNNVAFKFAASTVILGMTIVGCKPAGYSIASASARTPADGAVKFYAKAQAAHQAGQAAEAIGFAERAVELAPRDSGYRMLLGDLYLKNGRFGSAGTAFGDVLTLDPGNSRAAFNRALALIAEGNTGEATLELDRLAVTAAPGDVGLAFALAGQPQRAIEMLEPAARSPGATARVRQNLALAYALAGEWQKARIVAAQDLSPADLAERLEQWAAFARPNAAHTQVASLLGVTPAADPGQPVRLALAPTTPQGQAYAAADPVQPQRVAQGGPLEPAPEAAPAAPAPLPIVSAPRATVELAAIPAPAAPAPIVPPAETPVSVSAEAPVLFASAPLQQALALPAVAAEESAEVAVPVKTAAKAAPKANPKTKLVAGVQFAAAVKSLVEPAQPTVRTRVKIASAPIRAFQPQPRKIATGGRYVVQLGAFRTAPQVEKAWAAAVGRYGFGGRNPLSTTVNVPGKGIFHRLAVSGFDAPADAARACQTVRSKGGVCFVRQTAGDAPVQWASRYNGRARRA